MEQKTTTTPPPMGGGYADVAEGKLRIPFGNLYSD